MDRNEKRKLKYEFLKAVKEKCKLQWDSGTLLEMRDLSFAGLLDDALTEEDMDFLFNFMCDKIEEVRKW